MYTIFNVWAVDQELRQMADYLKVLKKSLDDYQQKLEDTYTTSEEDWEGDDEANDRFNAWYHEMSNAIFDFPDKLNSSFLISWYSFVEDALLKLCDDMGLTREYDLIPENKPCKGIWRARSILQTCSNFKFKPEQWRELTFLNEIRNRIVHNSGMYTISLEKSADHKNYVLVNQDGVDYYVCIEKNLYKYVTEHKISSLYKGFFIIPSYEFCEYLISFGRSLFEDVFRGLGLN